MNENENLVPKRRFKEFTNSDAWEQRKLGEITESYSGGTPSVANHSYYGGSIPFIRSAEINSINTELYLTEEGLNSSSAKLVEEGDILYALYGATSGEVGISQINGAINQAILAIKPKSKYDPNFIMQWLRRQKNSIISTYLQGGQGNLSGAIVKDLILSVPIEYDEQIRIGAFFKQLDNTIALHQRKLEKSKALKSAYLSEMFPAEGERKPKRRFAGFTDDWEQRKLLDMSERICVGFVGTCEQYYTDSTGIPMYRTGNLNGLYLNKDDLKYVTQEFHNKNMKSQLKRGDILIARHGDSGKAVIYNYSDEANCLNIVIIRPNSNECDYRFLAQCINSPMPSKQIKGLSAGSTQSVINTKEIEKLVVSVPRNVEEQKVLANFFFNLDNVIALHQHKLEKLQNIKQAYLNELFV